MSIQLAYRDAQNIRHRHHLPDGLLPGVPGRFEGIVQRHHARLRRVVSGIVREPDRVDDVLQDAYLKAYRSLPRRFANEAHEATWLFRVVFNCCRDELRRQQRRRDVPSANVEARPRDEVPERLDLDRAWDRVTLEDRSVLLVVELLGFDYERAATILDLPRGTVASRLSAARRRFRAALISEGVVDA